MVVETSAYEAATRTSRVDRMIDLMELLKRHHDHLKQQTLSIEINTSVAEAYN